MVQNVVVLFHLRDVISIIIVSSTSSYGPLGIKSVVLVSNLILNKNTLKREISVLKH